MSNPSAVPRRRLAELVSIGSGYKHFDAPEPDGTERGSEVSTRGRYRLMPTAGGRYRIVQMKDIDDRLRFQPQTLDRVDVEPDSDRYLIRQGDVLFLSRGSRQYGVHVAEPVDDTVAAGYFYILRPCTAELDTAYLAWYLNQPPAQGAIRTLSQGSHVQLITVRDLGRLEIPVPPMATQRAIGALTALAERARDLEVEAADRRLELFNARCLDLVRGDDPSPVSFLISQDR